MATLAASVYGGIIEETPCGLISPRNKGWALPFDKWPADLQQEYTYNPTKARELLAEAGYPDGFKTHDMAFAEIELSHCNDSTFDKMIDQMKKAETIEEAQRLSISADQYALEQHWQLNILPYATQVVWQPYIRDIQVKAI